MPIQISKPNSEILEKYEIKSEKFLATTRNDKRDRVQIEIGDTKQEDFFPQFKIMRWDNEANLSVRLIENETGEAQINFEQEKIIWTKGEKKVGFYEIAPSKEYPFGGHEFDVILEKKPATNKTELSIRMKGLKFYEQKPLTERFKVGERFSKVTETEVFDQNGKRRVYRPENVVGSLAIYCAGQKINWENGKIYGNGKFGHIYKPKAIDAEGKEAWGALKMTMVSAEEAILAVELPQEFLDSAVYPIKHAAGLFFGDNGIGATPECGLSDIQGTWFTYNGTGTGTVNLIKVYASAFEEEYNDTACAIYQQGAENSSLITNGVTPFGNFQGTLGWHTFAYSTKPSVQPGTVYGLALGTNENDCNEYMDDGESDSGFEIWGGFGNELFDNPMSRTDDQARIYSVYAEYSIKGTMPMFLPA